MLFTLVAEFAVPIALTFALATLVTSAAAAANTVIGAHARASTLAISSIIAGNTFVALGVIGFVARAAGTISAFHIVIT